MASEATARHSVGPGEHGEHPHSIQRPTEEQWMRQISEHLRDEHLAMIKRQITAPFWSGRELSHNDRVVLVDSAWRGAIHDMLSQQSKCCFSSIDSGETYTGMQPIHVAKTESPEPIMSISLGQSDSSLEGDLRSASIEAAVPKVGSPASHDKVYGCKSYMRVMASSIRSSELGPNAAVDSSASSEDTSLRRRTVVRGNIFNPWDGEAVPCMSLLDTGAECSIMKRSLALSVLGKDKLMPNDGTEFTVEGVGGTVVPVGKFSRELQLACSKKPITITFYVLEDEAVLDYDVFLSLSASVATGHVSILICDVCNWWRSCN